MALTALATGYGRMPIAEFARGLAPVQRIAFPPVAEVVICLRDRDDVEELLAALPALIDPPAGANP